MLNKFLHKETNFFTMFEKAALNVNRAAILLIEMMEDPSLAAVKAKEIYEVEQANDMLTHEVIRSLNKTFITPMDREDIHALVMKLNDILDLVWSTADKTVVFQLNTSRMDAVELAKLVDEFTDNSIRCCINKIKD